ncbi:MAG: hypothetical protein JJT78_04255 [Leptospira sp.]|nr:hypothetical protein [Leptospira sp.]
MVDSDSKVEVNIDKAGKRCACGKLVSETYQNDLCRECLTQRFKSLIKVIDSVRK